MKRREFIKTSAAAVAAISVTGLQTESDTNPSGHRIVFPRYRGFNLTEKAGVSSGILILAN